jgi:hypothetical protein
MDLVLFQGKVAMFRLSLAILKAQSSSLLAIHDGLQVFPASKTIPCSSDEIFQVGFFIHSL